MTTATAVAPGLEQLRREISTLETEIADLKAKREAEEKALSAFTEQRTRINEAIARGTEKASAVIDLNRKLEQSKATIEGFNGLIAGPQRRLEQAYGELRRGEVEARCAAELAEVVALEAEGAEIVARIANVLAQASGELSRYHQVRAKLNLILDRTPLNVFPILPIAFAANKARGALDKSIAENFAPILKLWQ